MIDTCGEIAISDRERISLVVGTRGGRNAPSASPPPAASMRSTFFQKAGGTRSRTILVHSPQRESDSSDLPSTRGMPASASYVPACEAESMWYPLQPAQKPKDASKAREKALLAAEALACASLIFWSFSLFPSLQIRYVGRYRIVRKTARPTATPPARTAVSFWTALLRRAFSAPYAAPPSPPSSEEEDDRRSWNRESRSEKSARYRSSLLVSLAAAASEIRRADLPSTPLGAGGGLGGGGGGGGGGGHGGELR